MELIETFGSKLLHLFGKCRSKEEVLASVTRDLTIGEGVRGRATDLVPRYERGLDHRRAWSRVYSMARRYLLRPAILEGLRNTSHMSETVRKESLAIAERFVERPLARHFALRSHR